MKSSSLLGFGASTLLASFPLPDLAIPLLSVSAVSFLAAEAAIRYEQRYERPVLDREYAVWQAALDHRYEHLLGVQQALAENEIDWQAQAVNRALNTQGTIENKYFMLFTAGRSGATPPSEPLHAETPSPDLGPEENETVEAELDWRNAADLPEDASWNAPDTPLEKKDDIAEEDIAALIARNSTDRDNCSSILIACPRGTGKSNLLRAAIRALYDQTGGSAQVSIFNGKEDRDINGTILSTFCGLEKDPARYINAGDPANIEESYRRLHQLTQELEEPSVSPRVQVLDEYNNQLIAAAIQTSLLKDAQAEIPPQERQPIPDLVSKIKLDTTLRITKGRSKLVSDWITSHSPLVQDIGLNTMLQQSLTSVVLGRGDKLDALHTALNGKQSLVRNPQLRAALYDSFLRWEELNDDPYKVVCLTNLAGRWRLCLLPRYPDSQPEVRLVSE